MPVPPPRELARRQPLHALALLLDHAVHSSDDPKVTHTPQQAARSVDSLGRLFAGLLDLSQLDAGSRKPEVQPLSLKVLLRRLENDFRPLAQEKGLAFSCEGVDTWVRSDRAMLERLLRNLLDNALKYTEKGGIELSVEPGGEPNIEPGVAATGPRELRLSVRDTGLGIDAARLAPDAVLTDRRLARLENGLQAIERLWSRYGRRPAAIVAGEISPADLDVPQRMPVTVMQEPPWSSEIGGWLVSVKSTG